jgi:hypothetical protein
MMSGSRGCARNCHVLHALLGLLHLQLELCGCLVELHEDLAGRLQPLQARTLMLLLLLSRRKHLLLVPQLPPLAQPATAAPAADAAGCTLAVRGAAVAATATAAAGAAFVVLMTQQRLL